MGRNANGRLQDRHGVPTINVGCRQLSFILFASIFPAMTPPAQVMAVGATEDLIPLSFELSQNYQNPFNPMRTIIYVTPTKRFVNLTVFDVRGRNVVTPVDWERNPEGHNVDCGGSVTASGRAGAYIETTKAVFLN